MDAVIGGMPDHHGLDLEGDEHPVAPGEDVEFGSSGAYVAAFDHHTTSGEEPHCDRLAESAHMRAGPLQMAVEGSSSSMLTSRKVITLTRFTKRAGRYMSHTHASSSSSSKYTEPSAWRVCTSTPLAR